jgi:signal transduction histidine kinase
MNRSLTRRLIGFSIFWIVLALVATAILLGRFYREHIEEHYDAHITSHLEELIAAVEPGPNGEPMLPREPTDPRFHRPDSGWYWEILSNGVPVRKSASLGAGGLELGEVNPDHDPGVKTVYGPGEQKLRAVISHVSYPHEPGSLLFVATAPEVAITDDVHRFYAHILTSFLVLGIGLSVAVVVQVTVALKPLRAIKSAISDIKSGRTQRLPQIFPGDVQPLADELNFLLDHNETLLKRARNQLGDLAHSVKNPLAVIRNEARNLPGKEGQLILDQSHAMANSIDHCLARARIYGNQSAIGYRTRVQSALDDICFAVEHMYKDRDIALDVQCTDDAWFRGDSQDLEEMAGNLIDNAFKWAKTRVLVRCSRAPNQLILTIEDDGPGIAEEELATITRRGRKLDPTVPGDGQGLGIVEDIARLYGGKLELGRSALGGLQAELHLPAP